MCGNEYEEAIVTRYGDRIHSPVEWQLDAIQSGGLVITPYFTHGKLTDWIDEAGKMLGYEVKHESRRKTHGKIFQIDSMWFQNQELFAFVEAEKRWEMNHIIGHLTCCADYAFQEQANPFFVLVYLENEANHCKRLRNTWDWLTRMVPSVLKVRCLPIYTKKNDPRLGLHASTITIEAFRNTITELTKYDITASYCSKDVSTRSM